MKLVHRLRKKLGVDKQTNEERQQEDAQARAEAKQAIDRIDRLIKETDAYYDSLRRS